MLAQGRREAKREATAALPAGVPTTGGCAKTSSGSHFRLSTGGGQFYNCRMLPKLIAHGGPVLWLLIVISGVALVTFVERMLHLHRAQINSIEFLNGVRTVLKRANVVEALSICDATPGPVAQLVKTAILNRDRSREELREALQEARWVEAPRLEEKLGLLATIAQITPMIGLLGTALGLIEIFGQVEKAGVYAELGLLSGGVWQALICTAAGLAIAIPTYAGYNYLIGRVNDITLDMDRASAEIIRIVTDKPAPTVP